ncbi:hypothetical protein [Streptomyces sp900116325]
MRPRTARVSAYEQRAQDGLPRLPRTSQPLSAPAPTRAGAGGRTYLGIP